MIIASSSPTIVQKESTEGGASPLVGLVSPAASQTGAGVSEADAELVTVDQTLYDSVRNPLGANLVASFAAQAANVIALAAAAANDPHQANSVNASQQLPTVATQLANLDLSAGSSQQAQVAGHAPLNASNTIKPATSKQGSPTAATSAAAAAAANSSASTQAAARKTVSNASGECHLAVKLELQASDMMLTLQIQIQIQIQIQNPKPKTQNEQRADSR